MQVDSIRSILTDRFHEAQLIMRRSELAADTVTRAVKQASVSPWAKRYKDDLSLMGMMVTDYLKKDYGYLSPSTPVIAISALLYVVTPAESICRRIPFINDIDRAAVLTFALGSIREELKTYKLWLNTKELRN